jgi:UDP-N-acetylmuramoyl-tripeptide--D-alanyl-D-alanine ligase
MLALAVSVACLAAGAVSTLRWLRVAQREHYEPGRVNRFARLWWPRWAIGAGLVAAALTALTPVFGLLLAALVAWGPPGLGMRGRTSALAWTRRLRTLAVAVAALAVLALVAGAALGAAWVAAVILCAATPLLVDAALVVAAPFERRAARRFVEKARQTLRGVDPDIVAITGSYGKTTTKGYVRHLVEGTRRVVASPASFNNTAGLSRAVNEHLTPGTEVFVAEMGAYGPGEIAELCSWVQPRVGAIVAIGPVHLERFGSLDRIVAAKSEITDGVDVAVLNVDAHGLADVAHRIQAAGRKVVRCSAGSHPDADVAVTALDDRLAIEVYGSPLAEIPLGGAHPTNVACAVGIALALDVEMPHVAERLATLPTTEHRQQVVKAPSGALVVDDTFNANPAGAAAALEVLARHRSREGKAVVVTPGMIELGPEQHEENRRFAEAAARQATHLLVVGRTNRAALLEGARGGTAEVLTMPTRDDAVAWVRSNLAAGDVVLYENDLPDHYP